MLIVVKNCKFASIPQFTLVENITCFAYDFYTHVSTMEAELCTCDPNYNKVAAIKYTTETVVKNACYWVSTKLLLEVLAPLEVLRYANLQFPFYLLHCR